MVIDLAEAAGRTHYKPRQPHHEVAAITYTDYLGIRVRPGREIWSRRDLGFTLHPMPLGALHRTAVELNILEGETVAPVSVDRGFYEHSLPRQKIPAQASLGISGFRITAPLNSPTLMDELIVFQGASYFRAVSQGQVYGLSARALTVNAGQSYPEEFPFFRRFWIETPRTAEAIRFHALLDGPSVVGAFSFTVRPGSPTVVEVEVTLFPRVTLQNVGLAPLTSMYFYSVGDGANLGRDYRPAVHDSEGLLIENGRAEKLWRPLRNPTSPRTSSFEDTDPKGFGLMQRQRKFDAYQDLEANYHRRPSAWVEPLGSWGNGAVELIELPTTNEFNDNIVTQWRPSRPLLAGQRFDYAYRISWLDDEDRNNASATINWTRSGPAVIPDAAPDAERFVIDYALEPTALDALPEANVSASNGNVSGVTVQRNPMTGGVRLSFIFEPDAIDTSELRASLNLSTGTPETWLYQWTRAKPGDPSL